jgi:hypothetical protein
MKGGFIDMLFASGVGAYAAKKSSSMSNLLWTLLKYSLVILAIYIAIVLVTYALGGPVEKFVPLMPSPEQDQKVVTPAGNVITY